MKKHYVFGLSVLMGIGFLSSCDKRYDDVKDVDDDLYLEDLQFVGPLGQVNTDAAALLRSFQHKGTSTTLEDGTLALEYKGTATLGASLKKALNAAIGAQTQTFTIGDDGSLSGELVILDKAVASAAQIENLSKVVLKKSTVNVESAADDNVQVSLAGTPILTASYNLAEDKEFDLTDNGTAYVIPFTATGAAGASFDLGLSDVEVHAVYGKFGALALTASGSKSIDIKSILGDGSKLIFKNPVLSWTVYNGAGVDATAVVSNLKIDGTAINATEGTTLDIAAAPELGQGTEATATLVSDDLDAEFDAAELSKYSYSVALASKGTPEAQFIDLTNLPKATVSLALPLVFDEDNVLVTSDTLVCNLTDLKKKYYKLKALELRAKVENSLPLDVTVEITFLDKSGNPVSEIAPRIFNEADGNELTGVVKSAEIDANGQAVSTTKDTKYVILTEEELAAVEKIHDVEVKTIVNGQGAENKVNIQAEDHFYLKADIWAQGDVEHK